jgi:hypothetical protein
VEGQWGIRVFHSLHHSWMRFRRGARPQGLTREFAGLSAYMSANNPRLINNFHFQPVDGQASPHPTASTALWSSILVRARPGARRTVGLCTGPRKHGS